MSLLTVHEAAAILRLSARQVERYVRSGALPSVVLGAARRIDPSDLEAFIAEHRQAAGVNGA